MSSVRNISHKRKELHARKWSLKMSFRLLRFRLKTISRNIKTAIRLGWNGDVVVDTYDKLIRENASLHMENMRLDESLRVEVEINMELSKEISDYADDPDDFIVNEHELAEKHDRDTL